MNDLSLRQQRLLSFVKEYSKRKGYPPSIRDMKDGCDISSTSVVSYNLAQLERRGYLEWDRETARSLRVLVPDETETAHELLAELWGLPFRECVPAGLEQRINDYLGVDGGQPSLSGTGPHGAAAAAAGLAGGENEMR